MDAKKLSLFAITWPIFVEMLLFMLMGNMDVFMLSRHSDEAVAGVGVANQFVQMAITIFGFISLGASVIIAQYLGAEKHSDAKKVAGVSLYCNLVFGLVLGLVFVFGRGLILATMPNLYYEVRDYASIVMLLVGGFIFTQGLLGGVNAILRSYGYTRDTLITTASMNVMNIIGNFIVLFGPFGLPVFGVTGVAVVTVVSRTAALGLGLWILHRRVRRPLGGIRLLSFPFVYVKKILRIGVPAAGESLAYIGYQTFLTTVVAGMGSAALSTRIYSRALNIFMFVLTISLAQGGQIIIGHLMGAKEYDEIYKKCLKILRVAALSSVAVAIVFNIFSAQLFGLFTDNPEIIAMGQKVLFVFIFLEIGRAINLVVIGSLRAVGDVKFPMVVGIFSMWGFGALGGFTLGVWFNLGVLGTVIGVALDECIRGIIMLFRWKSRVWQKKGVT
ncbi:MAG: MATE family efflux transporter [Defluviitaleaceae bacterium]|nr:MATE family efflux transporter [Defluviitaleaceae bacterium]MCL2263747.1 MATE family efflux transporter [Defluviitaleaceae bacterium]